MIRIIRPSYLFSSYFKELNLQSTHDTFYYNNLVKTFFESKVQPTLNLDQMEFGQQTTDLMVSIKSKNGIWGIPQIKPFQHLLIHPFNSSLHYAVQCYEGLKAYKNEGGEIRLFRPECNMKRFKQSSKRIALPDFDGSELVKILEQYVRVQKDWIPSKSGFSLYIRPYHISLEESLGVKGPNASELLIVASPVGPYYPKGFNPISLSCNESYVKSAPGGTGGHNVGGNLAPIIEHTREANEKGYHKMLYLWQGKVGEAGSTNIFFVLKDKKTGKKEIITPSLEDLVLPGVTRDTIIELLRSKGYKVHEKELYIEQLIEKHKKGELVQSFCASTAVIVSPVNNIEYGGVNYEIEVSDRYKSGELTYEIFNQVLDIQEGRMKNRFNWSRVINAK